MYPRHNPSLGASPCLGWQRLRRRELRRRQRRLLVLSSSPTTRTRKLRTAASLCLQYPFAEQGSYRDAAPFTTSSASVALSLSLRKKSSGRCRFAHLRVVPMSARLQAGARRRGVVLFTWTITAPPTRLPRGRRAAVPTHLRARALSSR